MKYPTFRKGKLINRCRFYQLAVASPRHPSPGSLILNLSLFFTACPDNNHPPPMADCDPGYHPCGEDSTECCLDTTSHNFVWEIDTLGDYGSYLNDVAIIDENNVWVVGYIKDGDSTYNAAHWDGSGWELVRIQPERYLFGQYTSVFGFESNDVWFGSSIVVHWDGNSFTGYGSNEGYQGGFYAKAIWGTSSSDMYFVGGNGSIVHYDGSGFTKMESGTDVDLLDIDGTPDGEHVFVRGYDEKVPSRNIILEFNSNEWNTIYYIEDHYFPEPGDYGHIEGIGVFGDTLYVSTVAGLWKYSYADDNSLLVSDSITHFNQGAFIDIHIASYSDIYFDGAGFKYVHYNGSNYDYNQEIYEMYPQRANRGSDYNGKLVVVVGFFNWYEGALVARGYHE